MKTTKKDLALYLGVTASAVSQYNQKKLELMLYGLAALRKKHTEDKEKLYKKED